MEVEFSMVLILRNIVSYNVREIPLWKWCLVHFVFLISTLF